MRLIKLIVPFALVTFLLLFTFAGCRDKSTPKVDVPKEDLAAKKMLQGIWINEDDDAPTFKVKGDTIFYPDSTSSPVYFRIVKDTLELHGADTEKYHILKQSAHLFIFKNQNGEQVRLTLSENPDDNNYFDVVRPVALNQNQLIKRDSVVMHGQNKYHYYVQVNPTTFKVVKSSMNEDGVEVDNVYFDNIIHISVFQGASQLFSKDFHRMDFKGKVPANILGQCILSDIDYASADEEGLHFTASNCIPDSPSSYQVDICISYQGKLSLAVK